MSMIDSIRDFLSPSTLADLAGSLKPTRSGLLRGLGYFLFGAIVFVVVFASKYSVRHADEFARKITADIQPVKVEFSYLAPTLFPPRATLDYVRITDRKTKQPILLMKDVDLRLSVLPLLMGKGSFSIKSRMFGGVVDASFSTGTLFNTDWISGDVSLEMVELQTIPQIKGYDKTLKGFASLEASFEGKWGTPQGMEADLYANLAQLDMENRFPIIKGARLKGFRVDLDCSLADGVITVRDFDLKDSAGISLKSDGTISLAANNFNKSLLKMQGKFIGPPNRVAMSVLDPKAAQMLKKKQAVPVNILGTVGRPNIKMK